MPKLYYCLAAVAALTAGGCTSAPEETPAAVAPAPKPAAPAAPAPPSSCPLPAYDFARIGTGPRLSAAAVQRMLQRNSQLPSIFRGYNQYVDLHVLDTLRCPGYALVTVLYRHEDCCEDLYYLTTPPSGTAVLDSMRVAMRGLDGQWHAEALLRPADHGELRVIALEENSTDTESEPNTLDSVVTAYRVTPRGRFERRQISSAQRNLRPGEHIPLQE